LAPPLHNPQLKLAVLKLNFHRPGAAYAAYTIPWPVPKLNDSDRAVLYREKAEEITARAESLSDHGTREVLLRLATDYLRLAEIHDAMAKAKQPL
jgi:hypothetical protein